MGVFRYGPRSNLRWLLSYGFVPNVFNSLNIANVRFELNGDIHSLAFSVNYQYSADGAGTLKVFSFLRLIFCSDPKAIQKFPAPGENDRSKPPSSGASDALTSTTIDESEAIDLEKIVVAPMSLEVEIQVLGAFRQGLEASLERMSRAFDLFKSPEEELRNFEDWPRRCAFLAMNGERNVLLFWLDLSSTICAQYEADLAQNDSKLTKLKAWVQSILNPNESQSKAPTEAKEARDEADKPKIKPDHPNHSNEHFQACRREYVQTVWSQLLESVQQ